MDLSRVQTRTQSISPSVQKVISKISCLIRFIIGWFVVPVQESDTLGHCDVSRPIPWYPYSPHFVHKFVNVRIGGDSLVS